MKQQVSEEECWFVIGAHQAGASERQCAELSGLSKTITHNIIRNFKKLGSPHASKLSVDALLRKRDSLAMVDTKRKSEDVLDTPRKRGRPRNPEEPPFFTRSIVQETLYDVREDQKPVNSNTHSIQVYPLDRLNTPPSDEDQQTESLKIELPLTPRLDDEEEEEEEEWTMKDDKELITHVLGLPLKHIKWKEVENQFEDRHLAKMCADRWEYLKKQLLKDVELVSNNKIS